MNTSRQDLQLVRGILTHVGPGCSELLSDFEFERLIGVLGEMKRGAHLSDGQRLLYGRIAERIGVRDGSPDRL